MTSMAALCAEIAGLQQEALERWIAQAWVRPDRGEHGYVFREIDVVRVRLIVELHQTMALDDEALGMVLSLLDQLYDARRQLHQVQQAIETVLPEEARRRLAHHLAQAATNRPPAPDG
jgi:chaperone modulatory protein CbpM